MTFRLFRLSAKEYIKNPQDWALTPNGSIVDLDAARIIGYRVATYPPQDFIVESWTGYFDDSGRKIYCGDIIFMDSFFPFKSKIVWKHGAFVMVPMDSEGLESAMGFSGILTGWNVTGNIHDAEFSGDV